MSRRRNRGRCSSARSRASRPSWATRTSCPARLEEPGRAACGVDVVVDDEDAGAGRRVGEVVVGGPGRRGGGEADGELAPCLRPGGGAALGLGELTDEHQPEVRSVRRGGLPAPVADAEDDRVALAGHGQPEAVPRRGRTGDMLDYPGEHLLQPRRGRRRPSGPPAPWRASVASRALEHRPRRRGGGAPTWPRRAVDATAPPSPGRPSRSRAARRPDAPGFRPDAPSPRGPRPHPPPTSPDATGAGRR